MSIPCILALHKDSLIGFMVANIIGNSDEFAVIESKADNNYALMNEIDQHKADVILFENTNPLAGVETLARLLILHPSLLVIIIEEDNNWLHIFHKEIKLLTATKDLLDIIQSTHKPNS